MNLEQTNEHGHQPEHHNHEVEISIDRKHHRSPNPTTGAALYALGGVPAGYDLWREVCGQGDDELVPNDGTKIHLTPHEKFYSAQRTLNPGAGEGRDERSGNHNL